MTQAVTELIVRGDGALATLDKFEDKMVAAGRAADSAGGSLARYEAAAAKMTAAQEKGLAITTQRVERISAEQRGYEQLAAKTDPLFALRIKQEREAGQMAVKAMNARLFAGAQEADVIRMLTQLDAQHAAQLTSFKQAGAQGADGLGKVSSAAKLTSFQMLNLSRQGNDVITMFAMGAAPMQIFASQAGQIYGALEEGPGGLRGSLKAIGDGLLGLITRFPVATAAIVALGAAVVTYKLMADDKIKSVDEVLKQHEANIKRLGPAYEEALKGMHKYADESAALANLRFRTDAADALRTRADEATKAIENMVRSEGIFSSRFSGAKDAIDAFMASIKAGEPEAVKFQETISGLRESGQISEKVAQDLVSAANAAYEAEQKLRGVADRTDAVAKAFSDMSKALAADAIAPLSRLSDEQRKYIETLIDHLKRGQISADQFKDSLTSLSAVNPDFSGAISGVSGLADQLERAQRAAEGLANTTPRTRRLGAMDEAQKGFDDAFKMWRRFGHDDDSGLRKQEKAADDAAKAYDRLISSAERHTFMMGEELKAVGKSQSAWEGYRFATDLYYRASEIAAKNNKTLTEAQIEQIKALGVEYIKLAQAVAEAKVQNDLMFERSQIGRTDVEQRVAGQLRDLYGDEYQSHMNGAIAGQIRYNEELKNTDDLAKDAFDTIIDALTSSGDLADNLIKAFAQIGKMFAQIGQQKIFDYMMGKSSSLFGDMPSVGGGGVSVVNARASGTAMGQVIAPPIVSSLNTGLETYAAAIRKIESGSYAGNYNARGPVVSSGMYAGDRAYGAYQVMGKNIESWTKEALGYSLTQKQFLADQTAQDKVFYTKFGQSLDKYGNASDAISTWFSGGPLKANSGKSDGYTSVPDYVSRTQANADAYPGGLKRGVSDGFVDANRRLSAANQNDPWSNMRETSVATNGGGGMQGLLGVGGAAIGAFAGGYQSGSPLMGGISGAMTGIGAAGSIGSALGISTAAAGPIGLIGGAIIGILGGIFGKAKQKREELKKAQQELENQIGAITNLMRTATGNYLGAMEKQFGDTVDEFQKAIALAEKAKNSKLANQLKDSMNEFFTKLVKDWNAGFEGTLASLNAGLGMDGEFLKGMDAVDKMRESLVGFVNDAKFFAEANGDLSKMLDARKKELGIGQKGKELFKPKDDFTIYESGRQNPGTEISNDFVEGYKDLGLQLIEKGFQAFTEQGAQLYTSLTDLTEAAIKAGFAIDEQGKVTRVVNEAAADTVARAMEAARKTALASLSGGKTFSEIEQAIQRLEGAAASLPDLLEDLGMSAEDAADAIEHHLNYALDNLRKNYIDGLNASINDLSDFGFLNEIIAAQDKYRDRLIDTAALGLDGSLALKEFNLSLAKTIKGADLTQDEIDMLAAAFPAIAGIIAMVAGPDVIQQVEDAKSALQAAYDKEKSAIEQTISRLESFTKAIKTFRDEMRLSSSSPLGQKDQVDEAAKQFRDIAQKAMGGDEDAMDKLTGVSQNYLDEAREYYASSEDYFKIWNEVDKTLSKVEDKTGLQLTQAQKQLAALDKQVAGLITINDSVLTVAQAIANLNAALGARDTALQDQIKAAQNAGQTADPFVTSLYKSVLNRAPDAEGAAYYTAFLKAGMSQADLRDKFIANAQPEIDRGYPQFAAGGDHMGGPMIVGEHGIEVVNTGPARIFNAQQTERMLRQSFAPQASFTPVSNDNSGAEMLKELQAVRAQLERLERGQRQNTAAVGASGAAITGAVERGNSINQETGSAMKRVAARG